MAQTLTPLLLLGYASLAFAQGGLIYDPENHFAIPPTPVAGGDFSQAVTITNGQINFEWVTNIETISLSIYQEGNSYFPVLIGPYSGMSYSWNGSTNDLGPDSELWPNFDSYGNMFFLGIRDQFAKSTVPAFYSRYFRLVDVDGASSSTSAQSGATSSVDQASFTNALQSASTTGAASHTATSTPGADSGIKVVAVGAGVGVGVGVPLLVAIGVIIWLVRKRKNNQVAKSTTCQRPTTDQTGGRHRLPGKSAAGFLLPSHPAELPGSFYHTHYDLNAPTALGSQSTPKH